MSNHVALTDDERKEVVAFWADYVRGGGKGRQPTAFQLDAINDSSVRDAFLFWQLGADPVAYNPHFSERHEALALIQEFGANPTPLAVTEAITKLMKTNNDQGVEIEDLDTGSVWVLGHIMWLLLGGDWHEAVDEATALAELANRYVQLDPENNVYPHNDPLSGIGTAVAMLSFLSVANNDRALELSAQMFGMSEDHENTRWARAIAAHHNRKRKESNNAA